MSPHTVIDATAVATLTGVVIIAGRIWLTGYAHTGRHAAPAKHARGLSFHDVGTLDMFRALKQGSIGDRIGSVPVAWRRWLDSLLADEQPEPGEDPDTPTVPPAEEMTAADQALGVPVSREYLNDLARTWEGCDGQVPAELVTRVYPYTDLAALTAAWAEFCGRTLKADALDGGTEHWSKWYDFTDLGNRPSDRAVEIARDEADDAWAVLAGGPLAGVR